MNKEQVVIHGKELLQDMQNVYKEIGVVSEDAEADKKLDAKLSVLDKKAKLFQKMVGIQRSINEIDPPPPPEKPKDESPDKSQLIINPRKLVQSMPMLATTVAEQNHEPINSSIESN